MTPQEENVRLQQQVNEELRAYSEAQRKATIETDKAAEVEAKVAGVVTSVIQIMDKLYNAQLKYTIAMAKGEKGASTFNDGIDAMTEATQIAAVALSLLVPGGPLIKGVVAGLTFLATQSMKTAAEMQKAANDQADATYKAFQAFSKAGATGADGLKGFFDDVNRMRLNVNQLDAMATVIGNSAKDMASMGGTVNKARGQFADLVQGMGDFETGMLNLGLSYDDQAEAAMGFMKLQSNLSQGQQRDFGKLAPQMKKYLENTEALARVTGMNRKEQEAAQEKYLSQQRFGAKVQQLRDENQNEAADLLVSQMQKYAAKGEMFAQAFADSTTGMLTSDASIKGLMSSNGKILEEANAITSGRIKTEKEANESFQATMGSVKDVTKSMNMLYQAGVGEDFLLPFKEGAEITKAANQDFAKQIAAAAEEVKKLINSTDEVDDQLKRYNGLIKSQNDEMLRLQASLNGAFSSAGVGLGTFTELLQNAGKIFIELSTVALNKMREILGIEGPTEERLAIEAQDEANTAQATMGEAVAQAPAKMIEAAGDIAALGVSVVSKDAGKAIQNVVDTAKKERVASDTEYLATRESRAAKSQTLGFGPGFKAPTTAADYAELERQRTSAPPPPPPPAPAPVDVAKIDSEIARFTKGNNMVLQSNKDYVAKLEAKKTGVAPPAAAPSGGNPAAPAAAPAPAPAPAPAGGGAAPTGQPNSFNPQKLLDYLGQKEARGRYDMLVGGKTKPELTSMTVQDVLAFQKKMIGLGHESTAVGKYQIIDGTLNGLVANGALKLNDIFNSSTQDRAAMALLREKGMDKYTSGKISKDQFADAVAKVWSSMPLASGKSAHEGIGSNKALGTRAEYLAAFAKDGGVFDGPKSGYPATLHGNEAVIPLKDSAVPVSMSREFNMTAANLGELVNIMKNNVGMQATMLAVLEDIRRSQSNTADNTSRMAAGAAN